jgi:hypothetical protein
VLGGARERLKQNQLALAVELARTTTEPLRAQYSRDPVPFVLAMALFIAQREGVHTTVGTPRSLLAELAKLLGLELEQVALFAALSRKLGLWSHTLEPYRELGVVADLGPGLLEIWQGGSAWDFGREEPEVLRAATSARQPSPARDLAASLLRALLELAQDRWVPVEIFGRLVLGEPSLLTLQARLGQWSKRVGLASGDTAELLGHALVDLFTLGVIDQAELGDVSESAAIRLNTRGAEARAHGISRLKLAQDGAKARLAEADGAESSLSVVGDPAALCFRVETATSLRQLLNAAHCFEIDRLDGQLFLRISADRIAARVLAGTTAAQLRSQLEPLAAWTEPVEALVAESTRPRARLDFVPSLGFLWIEDDALRLRLSSHPSTAALFLEPSPLGGLLVRANVGLERLVKACRAAGVVVWHDAGLLGAKRSRVTGKARTPEQR